MKKTYTLVGKSPTQLCEKHLQSCWKNCLHRRGKNPYIVKRKIPTQFLGKCLHRRGKKCLHCLGNECLHNCGEEYLHSRGKNTYTFVGKLAYAFVWRNVITVVGKMPTGLWKKIPTQMLNKCLHSNCRANNAYTIVQKHYELPKFTENRKPYFSTWVITQLAND